MGVGEQKIFSLMSSPTTLILPGNYKDPNPFPQTKSAGSVVNSLVFPDNWIKDLKASRFCKGV